jgi:hypothetical protein
VPAEPETRTCPICWNTFTASGRGRSRVQHTYCSSRCRAEAGRRRTRDTADNTTNSATSGPTTPRPYRPEPAAIRDCPHCGNPITIVALLTTPQIARPQQTTGTPDVIPLRRVRTT